MAYFPFFAEVSKLRAVIVGGGEVALEKVQRLLAFQGKITVIAPQICDEIRAYREQITLVERPYEKGDLESADYVIAATDDIEINRQVHMDAKSRGLLINVVDVPELCDFIFPSVLQRGRLVVGVSTSGAGPQVAIRLRREIEKVVPTDIEEILDYMAEERIRVKEEISDPVERRKYLIELANQLFDHEK